MSVPRWLDDGIRELIDDLREMPPIHVLQFAAKSVAQAGDQERNVRLGLVAYGHPETTMLADAMAWLADGACSGRFAGLDAPAWPDDLGQGTVRGAMRRPEPGGTRKRARGGRTVHVAMNCASAASAPPTTGLRRKRHHELTIRGHLDRLRPS